MKIATVISNFKTLLKAETWTSDSGTGTTSFADVFGFENWNYEGGYPFAIILDGSGTDFSLENNVRGFETEITLSICSKWSIIDKQDDDLKREEARLRIREAWDHIKTKVVSLSYLSSLGADISKDFNYVDDELSEYDLFRRNITFKIVETINR